MSLVRFRPEAPENADLAHLVERRLAKAKVAGSSPVIRSMKKDDCESNRLFSVKFVPYGTSEIHFVRESLASEPEIRLRRVKERILFHFRHRRIFH